MMLTKIIAQKGGPGSPETPISNPSLREEVREMTGLGFFQEFVPNLIGLAFVIGVVVFFFILLMGAIQWTSSGSDKTALEAARGKILNALIGIVILLSVFAFLKVIEDFFGINILTLDIGILKIQ